MFETCLIDMKVVGTSSNIHTTTLIDEEKRLNNLHVDKPLPMSISQSPILDIEDTDKDSPSQPIVTKAQLDAQLNI